MVKKEVFERIINKQRNSGLGKMHACRGLQTSLTQSICTHPPIQNHDEDDYNHALIVGEFYDVYDSNLVKRCTIRITAIELCQ